MSDVDVLCLLNYIILHVCCIYGYAHTLATPNNVLFSEWNANIAGWNIEASLFDSVLHLLFFLWAGKPRNLNLSFAAANLLQPE